MSQEMPNPKVGIMGSTVGASPPKDPASDTFSGTSAIPLCNQNTDDKITQDNMSKKIKFLALKVPIEMKITNSNVLFSRLSC